jgi:NADH-quinone oxidoreductase subunit M
MNGLPFITALTLLPVLGGLVVMGLPGEQRTLARRLAFAFSLAALTVALVICARFDPASGAQAVERHTWIKTLGVEYFVGLDGLSLLLVLLTAIVVPMALLASWHIKDRVPTYFGLVLLLQGGLFGTFTALNFFHWFLFWELSLVPAFFLIRLWGGPLRVQAATQFFVYTMVGSVGLLLAFLAIFLSTGQFDFIELARLGRDGALAPALSAKLGWPDLTTKRLALVIFAMAFLGFAVKVPLVPFHSWLPLAYEEAPVGTTMLLTGLMSKMGVYGFLRVLVPIFPEEMRWVLRPLLALAVASIVFSASAALAQRDLRRMFAYSSINHVGYCMLGIFAIMHSSTNCAFPLVEKAAALNGVFLQMFNHGLTASVVFWFIGMLEQRSGGLRGLDDFGGLRKVAPVFCGLMGIALFSSLGLPGLNGFIGEFLIFKGAFPIVTWATAISVFGLLFTAVFILGVLRRVFFGPLNERWVALPDLSGREQIAVAPAIGLMFVIGIYPQVLIGLFNSTVEAMVQYLRF